MPDVLFQALCATLDHFDAGFIAVSHDAAILHANRAAHEMMSDGWPIESKNGVLHACSKKATSMLLSSLRQLSECCEGPPSEGACLDICLADSASPRGVAIATLKQLMHPKRDPSPVAVFVTRVKTRRDYFLSGIAESFGFTPAETRVLYHFLEGGSVTEAALALTVSENTVKTHLQNIFAKTRLSRQGQLIKLINDLRPPLTPIGRPKGRSLRRSCRSHTAAVRV